MAIVWTQNLSVGVGSIDNQHKKLFDIANQLFEAGVKGQGKDFLSKLLSFLSDYTKTHFQSEESYMQQIGYPDYPAHKKLHTDFIADMENLKKNFETSGGKLTIIINANQLIVDWLTQHISHQDKKIGEYVQKNT